MVFRFLAALLASILFVPVGAHSAAVTSASASQPSQPAYVLQSAASGVAALERIASSIEAAEVRAAHGAQDNRPDRDLAAQEAMALWAQNMFWLGFAGTALSFAGVIGLFLSLRFTRAALEASRVANEHGRLAVEAAEDSTAAQVRAWMSISVVSFATHIEEVSGKPCVKVQVGITVKNHGLQPATYLRVDSAMQLLPTATPREVNTRMDAVYSSWKRDSAEPGAVFPGEAAEYPQTLQLLFDTPVNDTLRVDGFPVIVVCVGYRCLATDCIHQTRVSLEIRLAERGGGTSRAPEDAGRWPYVNLNLRRLSISAD